MSAKGNERPNQQVKATRETMSMRKIFLALLLAASVTPAFGRKKPSS